jgi:hypothetical protein
VASSVPYPTTVNAAVSSPCGPSASSWPAVGRVAGVKLHRAATAAAGSWRRKRELGAIEIGRIVAAMDDPHLILLVDPEADRLSEHPVVRHRLRPERVDLELRHHHLAVGLGDRLLFEHVLGDAQNREQGDQPRTDQTIARPCHILIPPSAAECARDE